MTDSTFKTVELELGKIVSQIMISREMAIQPRLYTDCIPNMDAMAARLVMPIWKKPIASIGFAYPANWYEAFRERWFPEWWLDKYPVKYVHHTLIADALYPEIPELPNSRHNLVIAVDGIFKFEDDL